MKALKLLSPGQLELVDCPIPKLHPGDVLIRVEAAGICGTDRHLFKGEYPSTPGSTLGHEFCGIVVDRGAEVNVKIGTRITCDPNIWCGECENCRRGRVNLCRHNIAIGIQRDGGFAEYCAIPVNKAHILPDDVPAEHGALCEPLACTLHGFDIAAPQIGERVIIIGGGVIGLMALQLAKLAGAEIMLITRNRAKQELGFSLGASAVAGDEDEARDQWPHGADIVFECAGVKETVAMAPRLTRSGGRAVILGVLAKHDDVTIEPFDLLTREVNLLFAFINPFTQERAADLIARGKIKVDQLITRRISLDDAAQAISAPAGHGEIRTVIVP